MHLWALHYDLLEHSLTSMQPFTSSEKIKNGFLLLQILLSCDFDQSLRYVHVRVRIGVKQSMLWQNFFSRNF